MEGIVKDLSYVGKTTSKIGFIISIVIGVILLYFSYSFFIKTDDFIKIWRTFNTEKKPTKWIVWPHSESKGWLNKIEGIL